MDTHDMESHEMNDYERFVNNDSTEALIRDAGAAKFGLDAILQCSMRMMLMKSDLAAVIDEAIAREEYDGAMLLLAAGLVNGPSLPSSTVEKILPFISNVMHIPFLAGHCDENRIDMLLRIAESGQLRQNRLSLVLLLVAMLLKQEPPPPRLIALMHALNQKDMDDTSGAMLGHTARILADQDTTQVNRRWIELSLLKRFITIPVIFQKFMDCAIIEYPDMIAITMVPEQGAIVVNREKIGRNEECPCGSGKKYKKCCMEKDRRPTP